MKKINPFNGILLLSLMVTLHLTALAQPNEAVIDKLINDVYKPGDPGAALLIAEKGKVVYRKAFGMADLELNVPMKPEMVFEIGSMTKQMTAVAVLMLMEEGKLSLQDEITKYIPDYPVQGHKITIHHLLTHTSGIKSYTSMQEWQPLWRNDMTPEEMIDLFKNQPMDFAPGEHYLYNNSAYFMLGYIIEKASGMSYGKFLKERIFEPLKMNNSYYGNHEQIIPARASGYQKKEDFVNAEYLSLTQPYAAGSVMSNVDDLLTWQMAVRDNKLVKKETIQLAFTDYRLNDGKPIHYGYGWGLNEINGSPTIEHSGGIFGYTTNGIWLPEEDVYVVMLTNRDDIGPGDISTRVAAIAIGKPYPSAGSSMSLSQDVLRSLEGVFEFEDGSLRKFFVEDGQLMSQKQGSVKFRLIPLSEKLFSYENSFSTVEFSTMAGKRKAVFKNRIDAFTGELSDKKIAENAEISLSPEQMKAFVGVYEVQPGFSLTFTLEDGHLMTQATGQEKFEVFPSSENTFFLKVVDARIEFQRNADGVVDALMLYQGGAEIRAVKK
ncbi:MAG: serine hydrolase [Bacteroidales bacterium]|nr:serine hydrolase [Bacteroidales bacterium]